jgi:hypothetical protein
MLNLNARKSASSTSSRISKQRWIDDGFSYTWQWLIRGRARSLSGEPQICGKVVHLSSIEFFIARNCRMFGIEH